MQPIWLIEANVDGLPSQTLQAEIRRQGMMAHVVKYLPSLSIPKDIAGSESIPIDACVMFRGTLPLMRHIQATRRWKPGGWCTFPNLACSKYYAHFGPFLLNRDYTIVPMAEAVRLSDRLFARHGASKQLFVRPDSVDKTFTGAVVDRTSFLQMIAGACLDPTALILVASPRKIDREWRLIVANGRIVSGSQYAVAGSVAVTEDCPHEVIAFAQTVLEQVDWRPDPMFIVDICNSEDGLRVLELNSFSCSAHHLADLRTVVQTASELAAGCW
jgi:hypothetical protein